MPPMPRSKFFSPEEQIASRIYKKAVAWALREISKKNAKAVYNFLQKYGNSKDVSTRWIIREGSRKLPENLRKKLNY